MANGYGINLKIAVIYIFIGNIGGKTIGKTIGTSLGISLEKIREKQCNSIKNRIITYDIKRFLAVRMAVKTTVI